MNRAVAFLNRWIVPGLTALGDNPYMAAIRAGMVSVVPLTIIGGLLFLILALCSLSSAAGMDARHEHPPLV